MTKVPFIAGSGRSGTTWILDALAKANDLRPVFEPLNPHASPIGMRYAHRLLLAGDSEPDLESFLREVIRGRRQRLWSQYRRQRNWVFPARANFRSSADARRYCRRLARFAIEAPGLAVLAARRHPIVKCIWANLMLGWIVERMNCQVVLVVRHPGAVIESELRGGWKADGALDRVRQDPKFDEATDGKYARLLARALNDAESLALRWLIENQPFIEKEPGSGIEVAFYEDLADPDDPAWGAVCDHLALARRPGAAMLAKPSQQSSTRSARSHDEMAGAAWRRALGDEHAHRVQGILDAAEFAVYSMNSARPGAFNRRSAAGGGGGLR